MDYQLQKIKFLMCNSNLSPLYFIIQEPTAITDVNTLLFICYQ